MKTETIPAGQWLLNEGDKAYYLFRLLKGTVSIHKLGTEINTVTVRSNDKPRLMGVFAAIVEESINKASVRTESEVQINRIPIEHIHGLIKNDFPKELKDDLDQMIMTIRIANRLNSDEQQILSLPEISFDSPVGLKPELLCLLDEIKLLYTGREDSCTVTRITAEPDEIETVPAGQWIFSEGDVALNIFALFSGRIEVHEMGRLVGLKEVKEGGVPRIVGVLTALRDDRMHRYSVKASTDIKIKRLTVDHVRGMIKHELPPEMRKTLETVASAIKIKYEWVYLKNHLKEQRNVRLDLPVFINPEIFEIIVELERIYRDSIRG